MERIIQTVSGHIGSGKSRSTLNWYYQLVAKNGGKPVRATIATPTNNLSKQYRKHLQLAGIPCLVISQDEGMRSASEEYVRQCEGGFEGVLLINHSVALSTRAFTFGRLLIIDEAFSPIDNVRIRFSNKDQLKDFVTEVSQVPGFYEIVPSLKTLSVVNEVYDREGENYQSFGAQAQKLAKYVLNEHYRAVIDQDSFDSALSGKAFEDAETVELQFTVFTLPTILDGYRDVVMISANFTDTPVYQMWHRDVSFVPNRSIEDGLDYSDLTHKAGLVELYHLPVANLSKTLLKRLGQGDLVVGTQMFYDRCAQMIAERFPGRQSIFCLNNHPTANRQYRWSLEGEGGGTRVITNPHGWNDLQDCNMGIFLAAINYDPNTENRLKAFYGISKKQSKNAICYQTVYQFLGRTSLRDKDSAEKVVLIVPDEGAAKAVQALIGCADSTPLSIDLGDRPKMGRPASTKTKAEKDAANRLRVKLCRQRKAEAVAQLSL